MLLLAHQSVLNQRQEVRLAHAAWAHQNVVATAVGPGGDRPPLTTDARQLCAGLVYRQAGAVWCDRVEQAHDRSGLRFVEVGAQTREEVAELEGVGLLLQQRGERALVAFAGRVARELQLLRHGVHQQRVALGGAAQWSL